jgi:hypothetical protein
MNLPLKHAVTDLDHILRNGCAGNRYFRASGLQGANGWRDVQDHKFPSPFAIDNVFHGETRPFRQFMALSQRCAGLEIGNSRLIRHDLQTLEDVGYIA